MGKSHFRAMNKKIYKRKDVDISLDTLAWNEEECLVYHSNKFQIAPKVCAIYESQKEFLEHWGSDLLGYTTAQAMEILFKGVSSGEYLVLQSGKILRLEKSG